MKLEAKQNIEQIYSNTAYTQSLLATMKPRTLKQREAIDNAQELLANWEKEELASVRKAFEK